MAEHIAGAVAEMAGGKARREDGVWRAGPDGVTWLFGHMYELAEPKSYDPKWEKWTLDSLPIIVEEGKWKLKLSDEKNRPHIMKIKGFLKEAGEIVNAGDPAREGQLLVDELLLENGRNPFGNDVLRLWVQSMVRKDVMEAIRNMRPNAEKRGLYASGVCRQRADWQHGMSFTRLYTILARHHGQDAVISVGRVQTPTLRIVVDRDRERINFKPTDHFLPKIMFRHEKGNFYATWVVPQEYEGLDPEGRLISKVVAEQIIAKVSGKKGKISGWKNDLKVVAPPLPFSLNALQTECSSKFGMTAKDVLDVAQSLYEKHKATSYPRTDSRHLPTAILQNEAPAILNALAEVDEFSELGAKADPTLKSVAWDDSKVSDHYGIIPTTDFRASKLQAMTREEKQVFLLIARSFLAQFFPAHRYRALSAEVSCQGEYFKASGCQIVEQGWKQVYGAEADEDGEDIQTLPMMDRGDEVTGLSGELNPKRTSPPPAFTDGTLVQAMENIHRFVTDENIKKRLKENSGIGTPATRADVIETLIRRKFIERKGKNGLVSSEMGRSVIDQVHERLKDPGLTAVWEEWLTEVEAGKIDIQTFMDRQSETLRKLVAHCRDAGFALKGFKGGINPMEGHGEDCPKCGKGKMITHEIHKGDHKGKKYLKCSNQPDCGHVIWDRPKAKGDGKTCSKCGKGVMRTRQVKKEGPNKGKLILVCSRYNREDPNGCDNIEWPDDDRKPKAASNLKPLPGDGEPCPKCGKGKKVTREWTTKEGQKKQFLACSEGKGKGVGCDWVEWVNNGKSPKR
jgi:DNA topoisomerase-3